MASSTTGLLILGALGVGALLLYEKEKKDGATPPGPVPGGPQGTAQPTPSGMPQQALPNQSGTATPAPNQGSRVFTQGHTYALGVKIPVGDADIVGLGLLSTNPDSFYYGFGDFQPRQLEAFQPTRRGGGAVKAVVSAKRVGETKTLVVPTDIIAWVEDITDTPEKGMLFNF
jgi:hypothetical protein